MARDSRKIAEHDTPNNQSNRCSGTDNQGKSLLGSRKGKGEHNHNQFQGSRVPHKEAALVCELSGCEERHQCDQGSERDDGRSNKAVRLLEYTSYEVWNHNNWYGHWNTSWHDHWNNSVGFKTS